MRALNFKRRDRDAATCNAHTEELRRCNDYLLQRNSELNRDNYELATENNKLQNELDKALDEHLFLSSEVERLTDRLAEAESAA